MNLSRYLALFVTDAREQLAGLERAALGIEGAEDPRAELDAVFRHLHSLKSSSATMGFDPMAALAHLAEDLAGAARTSTAPCSKTLVNLLLRSKDALEHMLDAIRNDARPEADAALNQAIAQYRQRFNETPAEPTVSPSTASTPVFAPPGEPHTVVTVQLKPEATAPAARAFLALRRLESLAHVLTSQPSAEQLRAGQLPERRLHAYLAGEIAVEPIREALSRVSDVQDVVVGKPPEASAKAVSTSTPASPAEEPAETFVRVRAELLDHLLELAGEMLLSGGRLHSLVRSVPQPMRGALEEETDRLRLRVKELNNEVLTARQTPVTLLSDRLPRAVRDLSQRLGKPLRLSVQGGDVTADRGLLETLASPMLHVVRNAADHGIESPEQRAALGKPEVGRISFVARRERDRVVIEVGDDGRGFDPSRLRAKAVQAGVLTEQQAAELDDQAALRLAFVPGLSTRDQADELSGRGVGMDAVLRSAERLGGTVQIENRQPSGGLVRWVLPVTAAVTNVLLVGLGEEIFALPMSRVLFAATAAARLSGTLTMGAEQVPAVALGRLLGLDDATVDGDRPYVVLDAEGHKAAVGVDTLVGQEEVVLRPLVPPLERVPGLGGTAILGSGRPVFVLDIPQLMA